MFLNLLNTNEKMLFHGSVRRGPLCTIYLFKCRIYPKRLLLSLIVAYRAQTTTWKPKYVCIEPLAALVQCDEPLLHILLLTPGSVTNW